MVESDDVHKQPKKLETNHRATSFGSEPVDPITKLSYNTS